MGDASRRSLTVLKVILSAQLLYSLRFWRGQKTESREGTFKPVPCFRRQTFTQTYL